MIEHLEAKRAHIEHLSFVVSSPANKKADIGYHFKLKDSSVYDDFEEGDVVGFFKDDNGTTSIQLLDNKNGKNAFMAGVISRSAYLEATPPMDENGLFCTSFIRSLFLLPNVGYGIPWYLELRPVSLDLITVLVKHVSVIHLM